MNNISENLIKLFPDTSEITFDDFFCEEIYSYYDGDKKELELAFMEISRPWIDIKWENITKIRTQGWIALEFLNEKTYIHAFPSLVKEMTKAGSLLTDLFIEHHFNVKNVYKDWEIDFILSLDNNTCRLIKSVLENYNHPIAMDAIDSYWG